MHNDRDPFKKMEIYMRPPLCMRMQSVYETKLFVLYNY